MNLQYFISNLFIEIIATLIVSFIIGRISWKYIKHGLLNGLTKGNLTDVLNYKRALEIIENKLKSARHMRIVAFMGKNLVVEPGLLEDIKYFLNNDGNVIFILSDSDNPFIIERSDSIKKDIKALKDGIKHVHIQIKEEYKKHYPDQVTLKTFNGPIWLKLYFIDDLLMIGFYTQLKSYKNKFLLVKKGSVLYDLSSELWNYYEKNSKEVNYDE